MRLERKSVGMMSSRLRTRDVEAASLDAGPGRGCGGAWTVWVKSLTKRDQIWSVGGGRGVLILLEFLDGLWWRYLVRE